MTDRPWEVWWIGLRSHRMEKAFKHRWTARLWRLVFLRRVTSYVKRAEVTPDPWEEWCAHAEQTGHHRPHQHHDGGAYACLAPRCGFTTGSEW